jgi:hypothetical protein
VRKKRILDESVSFMGAEVFSSFLQRLKILVAFQASSD